MTPHEQDRIRELFDRQHRQSKSLGLEQASAIVAALEQQEREKGNGVGADLLRVARLYVDEAREFNDSIDRRDVA